MRWGAVGGGIFAKTAKTPPLQSAIAGILIATRRATSLQTPPPPICACAPLRHRMRIPYAPHTSYLRETLRFLSRRGMGREGTRSARHLPYRGRNGQS